MPVTGYLAPAMLRSAALTVLAATLVTAAPAAADPFGELPFDAVGGVATCLRATGAPGELARWVPGGVELLRATAAGVRPEGVVRLGGRTPVCPVVAAQADGAAVAAQVAVRSRHAQLRAALREPGSDAFGPPVTLGGATAVATALSAAVAPTGDAVVTVAELRRSSLRLLAFRRRPGGRFGRPETLASLPLRRLFALPAAAAAMDAAGDATLAWQLRGVAVAAARPGGRFGAPQRLGTSDAAPALSEGPDGRALLALMPDGRTAVAERAPGQAAFGPTVALGRDRTITLDPHVAASLRADGAAVVAWSDGTEGAAAAARPWPGAFSRPLRLAEGRPPTGLSQIAVAVPAEGPFDLYGGAVRAAVGAGGFALSWIAGTGTARAALGRLDTGAAVATAPGGALRSVTGTAAIVAAGGGLAVAWADDDGVDLAPAGAGRVHLALAGARSQVDPPPPAVTVPRRPRQRRYRDQPLRLDVICAAACDVRVTGAGTLSRPRAGRLRFHLLAGSERPGRRSVRLTVRVSGPGGRRVRTLGVRVPEIVRRPPAVPQPLGVSARRRGTSVVVSWRAAIAGRHVTYFVLGYRSRRARNPITLTTVRARRAGRFHARLPAARRVHYVTVVALSRAGGPERKASAPVPG
jgi:hypothetical protein